MKAPGYPDGMTQIDHDRAYSMAREVWDEEWQAAHQSEMEEKARREIIDLDEGFTDWIAARAEAGDSEPLLDLQRLVSLLLQPAEPADKAATVLVRIVRDYQDHVIERESK